MEWVETTGSTLDAAKEAALDELGVDEQDAEFEILQEPKTGLFGRVRTEARIRARVRPTAPRAKEDRRDRRRSRAKDSSDETTSADAGADAATGTSTGTQVADRPAAETSGDRPRRNGGRRGTAASIPAATGSGNGAAVAAEASSGSTADADGEDPTEENAESPRSGNRNRRGSRGRGGTNGASAEGGEAGPTRARSGGRPARSNDRAGEGPTVEVALEEQGRVAEEFLQGLLTQFGLQAEVAVTVPDEDNVELAITGQDLGLLIGPKGATLLAIQDLTRTVVQRKTSAGNGRIHVDVSGYREKRSAALSNFARQVATQVVATGERRALEPMASPDRKVVHDALTDFEGVDTLSEGEDPRRRVIIVPAS